LDGVNTYVLNKCALVLEGVTLAQVVELVVEVLVDLAGGTILDEKTAEDAESAHPNDLAVIVVLATRFILDIVEGCHFDLRLCVTLAYERPRYPSSYRNPYVCRVSLRRSYHGHGHGSAW
jgi:hypothetical protein